MCQLFVSTGQIELKHEFRRIDCRISASYNLALNPWKQRDENRAYNTERHQKSRNPLISRRITALIGSKPNDYSMIPVTAPAPTVRPPSRIVRNKIRLHFIDYLSASHYISQFFTKLPPFQIFSEPKQSRFSFRILFQFA